MGFESVADAGPLIHLAEIGALSALKIFAAVHVPDAVWGEVASQGHIDSGTLASVTNLQRHSPAQQEIDDFTRDHTLGALHRGEQAALFVCHSLHIPLLLTDDLAARDVAQRLGIIPVGSLGIIVRAFRDGLFSMGTAEQHPRNLQAVSSLFVTSAIVELAIEQLHSIPSQS